MISGVNIKKIGVVLVSLFFTATLLPAIVNSAASPSPNTRDNKTGITYECGDGVTAGNCNFDDVISATKKIVDWGRNFALFFSVIVLAYAGFNFMISSDVPKARAEAKTMLWKVVLGIVFILVAWLIVNLILTSLGVDNIVKLG